MPTASPVATDTTGLTFTTTNSKEKGKDANVTKVIATLPVPPTGPPHVGDTTPKSPYADTELPVAVGVPATPSTLSETTSDAETPKN